MTKDENSILDKRIQNELAEIMGDDLAMLYETFIADTREKLTLLKTVIEQPEDDSIRRVAHSIKGSSKNVGASQLAKRCEMLEQQARAGEIQNRIEQYHGIEEAANEAITLIQSTILQ